MITSSPCCHWVGELLSRQQGFYERGAFVRAGVVQETTNFFGGGQRADNVQKNPPDKDLIGATGRGLDAVAVQGFQHQGIDRICRGEFAFAFERLNDPLLGGECLLGRRKNRGRNQHSIG